MRQLGTRNRSKILRPLLVAGTISMVLMRPVETGAQEGGPAGSLDRVVRVSLRDVTLADLPGEIEAQAGLTLRITDRALDLAPSGAATLITRAEIVDVPLRDGLAEILGGLLLTLRESEHGIDVVPSPLLARIGHRPTWDQVDLLIALRGLEPGVRDADLGALRSMLQFRVDHEDPWQALSAAIRKIGAGSGPDVLTLAAERLGWAWIVDGPAIVILPRREAVGRALDTRISLAAKNQPFVTVLGAIGAQAGVDIRVDERAIEAMPTGMQRRFSITLRNKPLGEVLDSIGGYTSLAPIVTGDGILFVRERDRRWFERMQTDPSLQREERPSALSTHARAQGNPGSPEVERTTDRSETDPQAGAIPADADPVVARITVIDDEGRRVEWLVRRSELPPDLREKRAADLDRLFDELRRQSKPGKPSENTSPN